MFKRKGPSIIILADYTIEIYIERHADVGGGVNDGMSRGGGVTAAGAGSA